MIIPQLQRRLRARETLVQVAWLTEGRALLLWPASCRTHPEVWSRST